METIKIYWKRFKSKTPKALKKIQLFLGALLIPITGGIGAIEIYGLDYPILSEIFKNAIITIPFMILVLKFATDDKSLTKENLEVNNESDL